MAEMGEDIIAALRRWVLETPDLQAGLFACENPGDFLAAVRHLAQSRGMALEDEELLQAMRSGKKNWIERNLP